MISVNINMFLYSVIALLKLGEVEQCSEIEKHFADGLATYLYQKYQKHFYNYGFNDDLLAEIDEFYKEKCGIADGEEERKYDCEEKDGLWLVLNLAIDKATFYL